MKQRDMADFYRRYPYPQVPQIEYDLNGFDHLRYLAHGCYDNPVPRNGEARGRMLVAGAGTREAVMWAASLPAFDVHGVDLSEDSLAIAGALAGQLGLDNLQLSTGDFERGEGLSGTYDFISSFGVLHHLRSPEAGLAQLERHLAPGGMMALMVYNDANRGPLQRAQRVIGLLCGDVADDPQALEASALEIVREGAAGAGRLNRVFRQALHEHETDRPQFADTMLNPREVSYTIPSLVSFLASAGLEVVSPVDPSAWDVSELVPPGRRAALAALPLLERMEVADHLAAPLFWVLVRRSSERPAVRPCLGDASLFWDIVPMPLDTGAWRVEQLVVRFPPVALRPKVEDLGGDRVRVSRRQGRGLVAHRIARRLVEGFDGARTLRQIAAAAAAAEGTELALVEDTLLGWLHRLIDELGLATPDATRCHRCPLRSGG